jgi:hypothetical protein
LSPSLEFELVYEYDLTVIGIQVPVTLGVADRQTRVLARIDTGATFCIFERELGEDLRVDVDSGTPQRILTAGGSFLTYGHGVSMVVLGHRFDTEVYFAATEGFGRNVLGRIGWLNRVRLGLIDYEGKLFLSPY